jgi:hypothetical protein
MLHKNKFNAFTCLWCLQDILMSKQTLTRRTGRQCVLDMILIGYATTVYQLLRLRGVVDADWKD